MKSVNLYVLSRLKNYSLYGKYYSALTGEKERQYKPHEAQSLEILVEECIKAGATIADFDNFYYGYIIPQIGKEFDILKIGEKDILNIELKSWVGDIELVREQLIKNKFYLAHLKQKQYFYTFNSNTKTLYKLLENNSLAVCDISELVNLNKAISGAIDALISEMFAVSQFIVSPEEHPDRFINGEYFLTLQQQQIKKSVQAEIEKTPIVKISGSPGTGKTLLLYELAKTFSKTGKVCFLQPGKVHKSQLLIAQKFNNITFACASEQCPNLSDFNYVVADECERYLESAFNNLLFQIKSKKIKSVLSFEKSDITLSGMRTLSSVRMSKIRGKSFTLSGKIRINSEINYFICSLLGGTALNKKIQPQTTVQIYYSNCSAQTDSLIKYLQKCGYKCVNANYNLTNKLAKDRGDIPLSEAYGKEFDNVCVVINSDYYLTEKGKLFLKQTNAFAENLYCALTRVRKQLCVIVENNQQILARAVGLLSNSK